MCTLRETFKLPLLPAPNIVTRVLYLSARGCGRDSPSDGQEMSGIMRWENRIRLFGRNTVTVGNVFCPPHGTPVADGLNLYRLYETSGKRVRWRARWGDYTHRLPPPHGDRNSTRTLCSKVCCCVRFVRYQSWFRNAVVTDHATALYLRHRRFARTPECSFDIFFINSVVSNHSHQMFMNSYWIAESSPWSRWAATTIRLRSRTQHCQRSPS